MGYNSTEITFASGPIQTNSVISFKENQTSESKLISFGKTNVTNEAGFQELRWTDIILKEGTYDLQGYFSFRYIPDVAENSRRSFQFYNVTTSDWIGWPTLGNFLYNGYWQNGTQGPARAIITVQDTVTLQLRCNRDFGDSEGNNMSIDFGTEVIIKSTVRSSDVEMEEVL